ncbi:MULTISPECIES: ribonuclease domain-containing protein [Streptomyces]|uniref:Ribonuclease n=1 Tax=Streptomyces morookaense TaxID=1970 RepID=A0A7Y7E5D0_STRMO|nr:MULTISPECIES: ribonuclease domain-containing protein [Streptomyces]MCC2276847.1 ribonuclease [Streptomyces sp. ET3-23]NVK76216.1 ribonuclease [Streptomyces morookaense]
MRTPHRLARIGALAALSSVLLLGGTPAMAAPHTVAATAAVSADSVGSVCYSQLPSQAHDTLNLIDQGGPFPYPRDGIVFSNREGALPAQSSGYYHEYTVITPGAPTRGTRRIITGQGDHEDYYTADHYASFAQVDWTC